MMKSEENLEELENTIFLGEVRSVHNYGAFVNIPGHRASGLIHRSQISKTTVDDASEVLQRGERVWCKVIGITDEKKISLSMKVVDQGSGKDLDPNGVQIHQDELKRKSFNPASRRSVIELEAVLKTTCTKCGTYGHLAKDCFKSPDGKTYELLPEEDDDVPNVLTQLAEKAEKTKHNKKPKKMKKHKKHKSHHKKSKKSKKKRKPETDSSESDSEVSAEKAASDSLNNERKIQRHCDEKSHRKRSHSVSPENISKRKK